MHRPCQLWVELYSNYGRELDTSQINSLNLCSNFLLLISSLMPHDSASLWNQMISKAQLCHWQKAQLLFAAHQKFLSCHRNWNWYFQPPLSLLSTLEDCQYTLNSRNLKEKVLFDFPAKWYFAGGYWNAPCASYATTSIYFLFHSRLLNSKNQDFYE